MPEGRAGISTVTSGRVCGHMGPCRPRGNFQTKDAWDLWMQVRLRSHILGLCREVTLDPTAKNRRGPLHRVGSHPQSPRLGAAAHQAFPAIAPTIGERFGRGNRGLSNVVVVVVVVGPRLRDRTDFGTQAVSARTSVSKLWFTSGPRISSLRPSSTCIWMLPRRVLRDRAEIADS